MKETIETRELILLDGLDLIIRGTYHKTHDDCYRTSSRLSERGRIGVLFLNSPSPTRAADGDSAIYWADSFAERGYPSFRLDLPGSGDSDGDAPTECLNRGGYGAIASIKIRELVTRFNLAGVVIVDQCATDIPELYAAASCPECKGLVLVDPCFDLSEVMRQAIPRHSSEMALQGRRRLSGKNSDSKDQPRRFPSGADSPEHANSPVLRRWREVASTGLPILIFKALGRTPKPGEFENFNYVLGLVGEDSEVVIKILDSSDRSFASRLGRMTVRQRTEQWLDACFPLAKHKEPTLRL